MLESNGWINTDGVLIAVDERRHLTGHARPLEHSTGGRDASVHQVVSPGTFTDIADVGTAVDLFISLSAHLEIRTRTVGPVAFEIGDSCHVDLPLGAISVWPDATVGP